MGIEKSSCNTATLQHNKPQPTYNLFQWNDDISTWTLNNSRSNGNSLFMPSYSYLLSIVSAHPSTAISCVAARKLRQKKQNVRIAMFGACMFKWSVPNQSSTLPDRKIIKNPIRYCAGISHDFLRPNRVENNESTIGAQRSFTLNGQWTKLNCAWK